MVEEFSVLTDIEGCLSAVSDDARAIVGRLDEEICAKPLYDLFNDEDKAVIKAALKDASAGKKAKLSGVLVRVEGTHQPRFDISIESGGGEKFYVFFIMAAGEVAPVKTESKEQFLASVAEQSGAANDAPAGRMVMVDFAGLRSAELLSNLGEDGVVKLRAGLEQALSGASADGQIGQLDESSYGVLSASDEKDEDVLNAAVAAADALGVDAEALGARVESIALDGEETDPDALNQQLSHVCNKFEQTVQSGDAFGLKKLSKVAVEIDEAVKFVEMALESGGITVTSREVRRLQSGDVAFQMVQGALIVGEQTIPVERLLVLADHPALCARYDSAVIEAAAKAFPKAMIVVDIGLPTLESGEAARIGAEQSLKGRFLGFRPKGIDINAKRSRAMHQADQILKAGSSVWFSNFSTAIAKSRQLRGAYVEIAASFLSDIIAEPERNTLMSGLLKVWQEVDVNLVAVDLDTDELRSFAHQLGVAYGVGEAADPTADAS